MSPDTPSDSQPVIGRRLANRYELVERRGAGGMAEVWEAIDHNLGRRVAVKMLHGHLAADPSVLSRFRSEAQAAARLTHPGIVGIYDTVSLNGSDAIIMELVSGRDLRTILDERPTLAMDDAVEVGLQLATALSHAHQHDIIHRDLKPANILVRPDRRVKLSDFGIAKALDQTSHTESGSLVGTVKYLAPEQIEGHPVDGRTDLYGLTTVLYEMLCGEVPFAARDLMGAMNRIRKDPPSARKLRPDLPVSLDNFLQKGLARNPANRYPDAATWSAELTKAVRGDAGVERPRPGPSPKPANPTLAEGQSQPRASIPMRPAPEIGRSIPAAGPGRSEARPRVSAPAQQSQSVAEVPAPEPLAKHVRPKRRLMSWLGPLIALALVVAAVATVWFLLRPVSTAVTDGLGDDSAEQDVDNSTQDDQDDVSNTDTAGEIVTEDVAPPVTNAETTSEGEVDETVTDTSTTSTTTTTSTTLPPFTAGVRALAFDPQGDNDEHSEAASRPFDGDPSTFWLTQQYSTRAFGQLKGGVGLIVEFETPIDLTQVRILTNRVDWSVEIYEAEAPQSTLEAWEAPLASFSGLGEDETLDVPATPSATALLVWITDLGLAPGQTVEEQDAQAEAGEIVQQLQIFELEFTG